MRNRQLYLAIAFAICGLVSPVTPAMAQTSTPEIIGGTTPGTSDIPWTVALINKSSGGQFCGGSLINANWVLTAAHCFFDNSGTQDTFAADVQVAINRRDLTTNDGELLDASQLITHASYSSSNYSNDIALVQLSTASTGQTATLLDSTFESSFWVIGNNALGNGWGATVADGTSSSNTLLMVEVPIVDTTNCGADSTMFICAGGQSGKDTCQGDSGGPLYVKDSGGTYAYQAGVVSNGPSPCAQAGGYGSYTRVANYISWIESQSGITTKKVSASLAPAMSEWGMIILLVSITGFYIASKRKPRVTSTR